MPREQLIDSVSREDNVHIQCFCVFISKAAEKKEKESGAVPLTAASRRPFFPVQVILRDFKLTFIVCVNLVINQVRQRQNTV